VASRFTIAEVQVGDVTILRMGGRLELEEGDLVFRDTRIDSAGIGMLVSKYLTTQKRGGTIKLLQLTRRSDHLMDITRLATVFEIFDDEADAVRSFAATT
jgi:anti-sigma B factor antagonist